MNETIKTLETRRSVRCFDAERMPSEEMIKQIVEAGEYAPTGRGKQSPRIWWLPTSRHATFFPLLTHV